jgi:ATP/maltotriose-dependent transcriptional regulator MalT
LQALWGKVCTRLGACAVAAGDYPRGEQLLRESLSISTADEERALALLYLGLAAGEQGNFPLSQSLLHDCLVLSRRSNEIAVTIHGLHFLELGATNVEAQPLCIQSLALARQSGRPDLIAAELNQMGWHLWCLGDYTGADACWQEGLALCQQLNFRLEEAWALDCLGFAAWGRGDLVTAEHCVREALAIDIELGRLMPISMCMADLSMVLTALGRLEEAIAVARQAVAITRTINGQMFLILNLTYLGGALTAAGDLAEARLVLREAIQRAFEHQFPYFLMIAFYFFAGLLERESRAGDETAARQRRSLAVALLDCTCQEEGTWQVFRERAAVLRAEIAGVLSSPLPAAVHQVTAGRSVAELVGLVLGEQSQPADTPQAPLLTSRPDKLARSGRSNVPLVEPLSEREMEVLHLLAQGLTNQQIADALTVVLGTVKAHNHHIFGKLGVSNRVQALARARTLALL